MNAIPFRPAKFFAALMEFLDAKCSFVSYGRLDFPDIRPRAVTCISPWAPYRCTSSYLDINGGEADGLPCVGADAGPEWTPFRIPGGWLVV